MAAVGRPLGCATELSLDKARGAHGPDARLKEMLAALSKQRIHTSRNGWRLPQMR
jgi:hypothetical protein